MKTLNTPSYICQMLFSAIIPTYNNLDELKACLLALAALPEGDLEVHVCVDGSTDGTSEWLENAQFPYPLLIHHHPNEENRGRSATRNLALPHLSGKYVLFLDSDMEAQKDLLQQHLRVLSQGDAVSLGTVQYHNRKQNLWVRYISERGIAKYPAGSEVPFNYFITPNTAFPTSWFLRVNGFDEKINRYGGEDMELGYRLDREVSPRFIYNQSAMVKTTQPKTLDEALSQLREYGATGIPYIKQKWPELSKIYLVHLCGSGKLKARIFKVLTYLPFRTIVRWLLRVMPFIIQKQLINYLVISYVHEGYRRREY